MSVTDLLKTTYHFVLVNKLSVRFGEDKTKCILYSREINLPELTKTQDHNGIKQYRMSEQFGCCHTANLNEEPMVMKNIQD